MGLLSRIPPGGAVGRLAGAWTALATVAVAAVLLWPTPPSVRGAPLGRGWALLIVVGVWAWLLLRLARRRAAAAVVLATVPFCLLLGLAPYLGLAALPRNGSPATLVTGPPSIRYRVTPVDQRTERIGLVLERVFREEPGAGPAAFVDPRDAAFDLHGNLNVVDAGAGVVQVFDAAGRHLRTLGAGRLVRPTRLAAVGGRMVVHDAGAGRLSIWSADGMHRGDMDLSGPALGAVDDLAGAVMEFRFPGMPPAVDASGDVVPGPEMGFLVATYRVRDAAGRPVVRVAHVTLDGLLIGPPYLQVLEGPSHDLPVPLSTPRPLAALSAGGQVYVSDGAVYGVVARSVDGAARWHLAGDWESAPFSAAELEAAGRALAASGHELGRGELEALGLRRAAVVGLFVGPGENLWVYPGAAPRPESGELPADVYSAEGVLLFSGLVPGPVPLRRAYADRAFTARVDPATGRYEVRVFRVEAPFGS